MWTCICVYRYMCMSIYMYSIAPRSTTYLDALVACLPNCCIDDCPKHRSGSGQCQSWREGCVCVHHCNWCVNSLYMQLDISGPTLWRLSSWFSAPPAIGCH